MGRLISGFCDFVCMCVCTCCLRKTAWAINTKLDTHIFYGWTLVCVDPEVIRSRSHSYQLHCRPAWVCRSIWLRRILVALIIDNASRPQCHRRTKSQGYFNRQLRDVAAGMQLLLHWQLFVKFCALISTLTTATKICLRPHILYTYCRWPAFHNPANVDFSNLI